MSVQILPDETWSWQNMTLWDFLTEGNYPSCWGDFFLQEEVGVELQEISDKIIQESKDRVVYPEINNVFRALYVLPMKKIRVIILGQDPYHNGNAVGLCFSIPPGSITNPSLRNIYNELEHEGFSPQKTGDLSHWAKQGCLMLNTALTVEKGQADSHTHIWYKFSQKLLRYVSSHTEGVAWLLMGAKALDFQDCVTPGKNHQIFATSHPSPFSAHKGFYDKKKNRSIPSFLFSGIFSEVNKFLGDKKINW